MLLKILAKPYVIYLQLKLWKGRLFRYISRLRALNKHLFTTDEMALFFFRETEDKYLKDDFIHSDTVIQGITREEAYRRVTDVVTNYYVEKNAVLQAQKIADGL